MKNSLKKMKVLEISLKALLVATILLMANLTFSQTGYRYLKITVNGGFAYDAYINEIEWIDNNIAYPITKSTSSSTNVTVTGTTRVGWRAYDGDTATSFRPATEGVYPYSITIDLGADVAINPTEVRIRIEYQGRAWSAFDCEGSRNGTNWTNLLSVSGLTMNDWTRDAVNTFTLNPTVAYTNDNSPMGMNLARIVPYSDELVFQNLVKGGAPWVPLESVNYWGDKGSQPMVRDGLVDASGYLKGGVTGKMAIRWSQSKLNNTGNYICTYEGTGTIDFRTKPNADDNNQYANLTVTSNQPGRIEFNLSSKSTIMLAITENSTTDPIRNIKVFEQRLDDGNLETFYPEFLENWKHFKTLRFMDWGSTNDSKISTWEKYTPGGYIMEGFINPVSYQTMVELCNTLNANGWFCIPLLADDNFVTQMATYIRDNLNPNLTAYIELSNEVWNTQFQQTHQAIDLGNALGFQPVAGPRYYGYRSAQVHNIVETVFAQQSNSPGFYPLTAWQRSTNHQEKFIIPYYKNYRNGGVPPKGHAIAPYFGSNLGDPNNKTVVETWTVDMVLDQLEFGTYSATLPKPEQTRYTGLENSLDAAIEVSNLFNIELIAYEGGQHIELNRSEEGSIRANLFAAANRHPRMKTIYIKLLDMCRSKGMKLFCNFNSVSPYKTMYWGAKELGTQTREEAPKYDALLTWIEDNPVTWNGSDMTWSTPKNAKVENQAITSVSSNDIVSVQDYFLFPNPVTNGKVTLQVKPTEDSAVTKVTIVDLRGGIVFQTESADTSIHISTEGLVKGVYIVTIQSGHRVENTKIMIQ